MHIRIFALYVYIEVEKADAIEILSMIRHPACIYMYYIIYMCVCPCICIYVYVYIFVYLNVFVCMIHMHRS